MGRSGSGVVGVGSGGVTRATPRPGRRLDSSFTHRRSRCLGQLAEARRAAAQTEEPRRAAAATEAAQTAAEDQTTTADQTRAAQTRAADPATADQAAADPRAEPQTTAAQTKAAQTTAADPATADQAAADPRAEPQTKAAQTKAAQTTAADPATADQAAADPRAEPQTTAAQTKAAQTTAADPATADQAALDQMATADQAAPATADQTGQSDPAKADRSGPGISGDRSAPATTDQAALQTSGEPAGPSRVPGPADLWGRDRTGPQSESAAHRVDQALSRMLARAAESIEADTANAAAAAALDVESRALMSSSSIESLLAALTTSSVDAACETEYSASAVWLARSSPSTAPARHIRLAISLVGVCPPSAGTEFSLVVPAAVCGSVLIGVIPCFHLLGRIWQQTLSRQGPMQSVHRHPGASRGASSRLRSRLLVGGLVPPKRLAGPSDRGPSHTKRLPAVGCAPIRRRGVAGRRRAHRRLDARWNVDHPWCTG